MAKQPNILTPWGDDIGWYNISHHNRGAMGNSTPNIDRVFALPTPRVRRLSGGQV